MEIGMDLYIIIALLLVLGCGSFMFGLYIFIKALNREKFENEVSDKIAELKYKVEVADFMKQHGVISIEDYNNEISSINDEVECLEELINER